MGNSYYVPRSVKGESRILYIFTIKSFAASLAFGLVGVVIYFIFNKFFNLGLIPGLIIIGIFAAIGYGLSSIVIPDLPIMGPLRKAGRRKCWIYAYKINFL